MASDMTRSDGRPSAPRHPVARPPSDATFRQAVTLLYTRFNILLRSLSYYDVYNSTIQRGIDQFLPTLQELLESHGQLSLCLSGNELLVSGEAIPLQPGHSPTTAIARDLFVSSRAILFDRVLKRDEFVRFLEVLRVRHLRDDGQKRSLLDDIHSAGILGIQLQELVPTSPFREVQPLTLAPAITLASDQYPIMSLLLLSRRLMTQRSVPQSTDEIQLICLVQDFLDSLEHSGTSLRALMNIPAFSEVPSLHPLQVGLLAIDVGRNIGLNRRGQRDLMAAALTMDVGREPLDPSAIRESDTYSSATLESERRHPLRSARELIRLGSTAETLRRQILVAFEHHLWQNGGGFPRCLEPRNPHLLSRIVGICDAYLTLVRAGTSGDGYHPRDALRIMFEDAERRYDRVILKILAHVILTA